MKKPARKPDGPRRLDKSELTKIRGGVEGGITASDDWETPVAAKVWSDDWLAPV